MRKKLRIAIIGCGGMGGGHAIALASGTGKAIWNVESLDECSDCIAPEDTDISRMIELAGVYDVNPERNAWASRFGIHVYDSYEAELNDPAVDVILIATPNHLHMDMAIRAMRAGKHVLCEKPVTPSSAELRHILAVSEETGRVFYPRQNRRWDKDFLLAKKLYQEKTIGELFNIECRIMGSRGIPGDWRAKKECGGGMLLDWGVHLIDRMLVFTDEPVKSVYCHLTNITNKVCDDGFKMQLVFGGGMTASLEVGTCHFINHPIWYLAGTNGTAVIRDWDCNGEIVRPTTWKDRDAKPIVAGEGLTKTMAPRGGDTVEALALPELKYDHNALYANLAQTIWGEAEQLVTGAQALRALRLIEAAMESSESRTAVRFE